LAPNFGEVSVWNEYSNALADFYSFGGEIIRFAGGANADTYESVTTADIYNMTSNTWTSTMLPGSAAVAVNGLFIFAGGTNYTWGTPAFNDIDVYPVATGE
jgi:hypothetical protein